MKEMILMLRCQVEIWPMQQENTTRLVCTESLLTSQNFDFEPGISFSFMSTLTLKFRLNLQNFDFLLKIAT